MADKEHLAKLKEGVEVWNVWRKNNPGIHPDLSGAELTKVNLSGADLYESDLTKANLDGANLEEADLRKANLYKAKLWEANLTRVLLFKANLKRANLTGAFLVEADLYKAVLTRANLSGAGLYGANLDSANLHGVNLEGVELIKANLTRADLTGANLSGAKLWEANLHETNLTESDFSKAELIWADLSKATLSGANLTRADLTGASLVETNIDRAVLTGCDIYGISAWDLKGEPDDQSNLIITPFGETAVTVDNLEVAQFLYLLLYNPKIRHVIDTVTSKTVLILGRFSEERKRVLDSLRNDLRSHDYVPIVFDFPPSLNRDLTETIQLLASMAKFVVADLTDAKSIPQELSHIIPFLPSVPIQPVILASERKYLMYEHWDKYPSVLPDFQYQDEHHLIEHLEDKVIEPAETWAKDQDRVGSLEKQIKELEERLKQYEQN